MTDLPDAADILASLRSWQHHKSDDAIAGLLAAASAHLEEYKHDWGIDFLCLNVEVPLELYVTMEAEIRAVEGKLAEQTAQLSKTWPSVEVDRVRVAPRLIKAQVTSFPALIDEEAVSRIWTPGRPRLFLSHLSPYKSETGDLKRELEVRGASAFVAHRDIAPSRVWQTEIEYALGSMDALIALVTQDFHDSEWTDQEVGFALGRGVHVLAVKCGETPRGFINREQALPGSLQQPGPLAHEILALLVSRPSLRERLVEGFVSAMEGADSYAAAKSTLRLLRLAGALTPRQKARLEAAIIDNSQVRDAIGVPPALKALLGEQ